MEKLRFEYLWCVHVKCFFARQHSNESENGEALEGQSFKDCISSIIGHIGLCKMCKDIEDYLGAFSLQWWTSCHKR